MNCSEAKKIDIVDFLFKSGINPAYKQGTNYWYNSPLRTESSPSFKVNSTRNIWFDHGTGQGGDIIKLIKLLYKVDDSGALKTLSNNSYSLHQPLISKEEDKVLIKEIKELSNIHLIKYILSRNIQLDTVAKYCKEVYFNLNDKQYYAIGFENNSKGFELRNKFFKGSSSPKDITLFKNQSETILIFEGFIDFLSWFECNFFTPDNYDFLIMNTLSFLPKLRKYISEYREVQLFLDNDIAGRKATTEITNSISQNCIDMSIKYKKYKDLNEYLIKGYSR